MESEAKYKREMAKVESLRNMETEGLQKVIEDQEHHIELLFKDNEK